MGSDTKCLCAILLFVRGCSPKKGKKDKKKKKIQFRRPAHSQELSRHRRLERRSSGKVSCAVARGRETESDTWTTGCCWRRLSGEVAVSGDQYHLEPGAPPGSVLESR